MKKMKKYFVVSLALLMGCSLTACQAKPKDPKEVYKDAQKRTLEMESYTADLAMTMTMDISMEELGEETTTFEIPITAKIETSAANTNDMMFHMTMNMEMLGEKIESEQWYFDGKMYSNVSDMKVYQELNLEEAKEEIKAADLSDLTFEKMSLSETDGKTILTIEPTKEELIQFMKNYNMEDAGFDDSILNDSNTTFEFSDFVITINADGFVESEKIAITLGAEGVEVRMVLDMTYSKINETTVEKIDVSDYVSAEELDLDFE